jgi:hypothetical protein
LRIRREEQRAFAISEMQMARKASTLDFKLNGINQLDA